MLVSVVRWRSTCLRPAFAFSPLQGGLQCLRKSQRKAALVSFLLLLTCRQRKADPRFCMLWKNLDPSFPSLCTTLQVRRARRCRGRATDLRSLPPLTLSSPCTVVGPVGVDLKDVDESAFRSMMEINAFAPLFLTQALLPHMATPGARVLHISSGAAHRPLGGANPYCTSKATLFFLYRALKSEFEVEKDADGKQLVLIGSARPGVVDTGMQVSLRGQDQDKYPFAAALAQKYDAMDRTVAADATAKPPPSDALDTATNAGHFLTWLLTGTTDEEFGGEEWDIRETSHHGRWCKEGTSASGS